MKEVKIKTGVDPEQLRVAHAVTHPICFKALQVLLERPAHVNELAREVGVDRRHLNYHLDVLEELGIVESTYEISLKGKTKGKALKMYRVTDRLQVVFDFIKTGL